LGTIKPPASGGKAPIFRCGDKNPELVECNPFNHSIYRETRWYPSSYIGFSMKNGSHIYALERRCRQCCNRSENMNLWQIDSSVLGENSASRKLTSEIVAHEKAKIPGLEVSHLDLGATPLAHLSPAHIGAMFGHPPADEATKTDIGRGTSYIDNLFAADIIVIGAPMYNFGIPSQLKALFDRLLVAGKTFKYGTDGNPVGLVPAGKKVIVVSTRGGLYSPGNPAEALDHQERHLTALLNFIGLTDITFVRAEGLALPDNKASALAKAEAEIFAL
jgi:FMN-dependent NADH-azoreductase